MAAIYPSAAANKAFPAAAPPAGSILLIDASHLIRSQLKPAAPSVAAVSLSAGSKAYVTVAPPQRGAAPAKTRVLAVLSTNKTTTVSRIVSGALPQVLFPSHCSGVPAAAAAAEVVLVPRVWGFRRTACDRAELSLHDTTWSLAASDLSPSQFVCLAWVPCDRAVLSLHAAICTGLELAAERPSGSLRRSAQRVGGGGAGP